jgi:hypothetical protein
MSLPLAPHVSDGVLPAQIRKYVPYYVLVLAVFVAYANVYDNAFLFDDETAIIANAWLRSWDHLWDLISSPLLGGENTMRS